MLMLEAAAVVTLLAVVIFAATMFLLSRSTERREPIGRGQWRATHYVLEAMSTARQRQAVFEAEED